MEYLIDGYNVLISHELGHDDSARLRFRNQLEARFAGKQVKITVVYDSRERPGRPQCQRSGSIMEVFVADADRHIIEILRHHPAPGSVTVVTSDIADIVSRVRSLGPRMMSSSAFLSFLSPPQRKKPRAPEKPFLETPENIRRYLREFGED